MMINKYEYRFLSDAYLVNLTIKYSYRYDILGYRKLISMTNVLSQCVIYSQINGTFIFIAKLSCVRTGTCIKMQMRCALYWQHKFYL